MSSAFQIRDTSKAELDQLLETAKKKIKANISPAKLRQKQAMNICEQSWPYQPIKQEKHRHWQVELLKQQIEQNDKVIKKISDKLVSQMKKDQLAHEYILKNFRFNTPDRVLEQPQRNGHYKQASIDLPLVASVPLLKKEEAMIKCSSMLVEAEIEQAS